MKGDNKSNDIRKFLNFKLPAVENLELRSEECRVRIEQNDKGELYCPKCKRLLGEEPIAMYSGKLMVMDPSEISARRRRKGRLGGRRRFK